MEKMDENCYESAWKQGNAENTCLGEINLKVAFTVFRIYNVISF